MQSVHAEYVIDDARERLDCARMHGWLTETYWSPGIPQALVEQGFAHSALAAGAYLDNVQVGCLRVVSDRTRFAYVADVFVDPGHRGRGLARAMVRFALDHPDMALVFQWLLGTADAHGVYRAVGFDELPSPDRYMLLRRARSW